MIPRGPDKGELRWLEYEPGYGKADRSSAASCVSKVMGSFWESFLLGEKGSVGCFPLDILRMHDL